MEIGPHGVPERTVRPESLYRIGVQLDQCGVLEPRPFQAQCLSSRTRAELDAQGTE